VHSTRRNYISAAAAQKTAASLNYPDRNINVRLHRSIAFALGAAPKKRCQIYGQHARNCQRAECIECASLGDLSGGLIRDAAAARVCGWVGWGVRIIFRDRFFERVISRGLNAAAVGGGFRLRP
jgi:hypothetical protein